MSRDVACRVSMFATTYKTFNINSLFNQIVEGISKCDFAMSRDVACRVSTSATMYEILNINSLSNQIVEGISKLINEATLLTNYNLQ